MAKFLESEGFPEFAFEVTPDVEHKFELALILNWIDQAFEIAHHAPDQNEKFKWIGDMSLKAGDFELAEKCYE